MAKKSKKRRKPGRTGGRSFPPAAAAILVAAFAAGVLVLRLGATREPPPLYEEAHSVPGKVYRDLMRVDKTVYDCLYSEGIDESRVFFTEVRHRHTGQGEWDFTEIQIRLAPGRSTEGFHQALGPSLDSMGPEVEWFREPAPAREGAEAVYHVYTGGRYTHRVRVLEEEEAQGAFPAPYPPQARLPKVAIVIDDLGYDSGLARGFLDLGSPVTLSILPAAPKTGTIVEQAGRRGAEIMLHAPMEPKDYPEVDPGPGALLQGMDRTEVRSLLAGHLDRMEGVRGVNNHMGSLLTESGEKMRPVMELLRERGLFFVDSMTTSRSVAFETARDMGVPAAKRSVFLDNEPTREYMMIQMEHLLGAARHRGEAVGIAHPFPETLDFLREVLPRLESDFEVVSVSEIAR